MTASRNESAPQGDAGAHWPQLHVVTHPLIDHLMAEVRDAGTGSARFRQLVHRLGLLLAYEAVRDFPTQPLQIRTPLESMITRQLAAPVTVVPILRAGLGLTEGLTDLLPHARIVHLGMYRDEDALTPVTYYQHIPDDIAKGPVIVVDPMLATGGSVLAALRLFYDRGCTGLRVICLVAAPAGVQRVVDAYPDVTIVTAALDRELNHLGYILPGLGDAGDRLFGTV